jgi:hypothetical protein
MVSLYSLTPNQVREACRQIFQNARFDQVNHHLTNAELQALKGAQMQWPQTKPVFSPFADVHDGYSQSESWYLRQAPAVLTAPAVRYKGTKYYCHRLTHFHHTGVPVPVDKDISHTLYCGSMTSRYIEEPAALDEC